MQAINNDVIFCYTCLCYNYLVYLTLHGLLKYCSRNVTVFAIIDTFVANSEIDTETVLWKNCIIFFCLLLTIRMCYKF